MTKTTTIPEDSARKLRRPLRLTHAGMVAERLLRAFWPMMSVILLVLAALMFGLHDVLGVELFWAGCVIALIAFIATLVYGVRKMRWPTQNQARTRLDETLPGRPISAIMDTQAIGSGDMASEQVWRAHLARMADRVASAKAVEPDLNIAARDPYAMRYVAILAFVMAVLFGSIWKVATLGERVAGNDPYAAGPSWEGWIEPPAYTGKPSIYLADVESGDLEVPAHSRVTLRLYGDVGDLTVAETISGRIGDVQSAAEVSQEFDVTVPGTLSIEGAGGRSWDIAVIVDTVPQIGIDGEAERAASGEMKLPFAAQDDYGVISARSEITLDLAAVDRRFGLTMAPETRAMIELDLPLPIRGDRSAIYEVLVENLALHPWAGLPVQVKLFATDAAEQTGASTPETIILPGRRFFDPAASAIIEQRRDLLWNRENGPRVAQLLRAISYKPDNIFRSDTAYLKLRIALRELERGYEDGSIDVELRDEIAQALWDIALLIEDGNLSDALERLRRAQDRLSEAMKQGASDDEIAALMDELREAMEDYMQQLAEQADPSDTEQAENQEGETITADELQAMLDRLQELMEQGRMEEAQALLDEIARMMENMQVTQGPGGSQSGSNPGQAAMEDLAETLREQQELNDETFGDLQEQYGEGNMSGQGKGESGQGLADRQEELGEQLDAQGQNLPGAGTEGGEDAREALDQAGRAMKDAQDSLSENDFASALDSQSKAMEALRDGMRALADEMSKQSGQEGQQSQANGQAGSQTGRDPLGRDGNEVGRAGSDKQLLQGEDVYRRARELLDEIRKRSSDQERPTLELDYLKRLLNRF